MDKTERDKTLSAVESVLGDDVPEGLAKKIAKMSSPAAFPVLEGVQ
jgi:hypothetical protein